MTKLKSSFLGSLSIQLLMPTSHSLKEKRAIVNSLKERMRSKLNVAVSEINNSEKWQSANLIIVTVSDDISIADNTLQECIRIAETKADCVILNADIQWQ